MLIGVAGVSELANMSKSKKSSRNATHSVLIVAAEVKIIDGSDGYRLSGARSNKQHVVQSREAPKLEK